MPETLTSKSLPKPKINILVQKSVQTFSFLPFYKEVSKPELYCPVGRF